MSDEKALLAAIWEHPQEDTPRLVYADWLTETEDPVKVARAEFIRLQCERAGLDEWDDEGRTAAIKQREEELWLRHRQAWKASLPAELKYAGFRRGFVYPRAAAFSAQEFLKLKAGAFDAAPQWSATLRSFVRQFDDVFSSPLLVRFDSLAIEVGKYRGDPLEKLADNVLLRNVTDLSIGTNKSTAASIGAFFSGPATTAVATLHLSSILGPEAFAALKASRTAARVRELTVGLLDADPKSLEPHFAPAVFPNLQSLRVTYHSQREKGTDATVRYVVASPDTSLRKLNLRWSLVSDEGAELLAVWPGLAHVRWLDLTANVIGERGYRALARSPFAGNLKVLLADGYWVGVIPDVKAELDARFGSVIRYG